MGCSTESTGDGEEQRRKEGMARRRVEWKKEKQENVGKGEKKKKIKAKGEVYERRGGE